MQLPYQPPAPQTYRPKIGLIGCGWVTENHLKAYAHAGYDVVALRDFYEAKALERQRQFYPRAEIYMDAQKLLSRERGRRRHRDAPGRARAADRVGAARGKARAEPEAVRAGSGHGRAAR